MNIVAQIFGVFAMIALFFVYQQKNRKSLIRAKLCADVCWVVHYFLLGAVGGMIPNFVGISRELVFVKREEKSWANKIFWPILFIGCNWILAGLSFKSLLHLIPIVASTFVTISLWVKSPRLTKAISIPVSFAFLVYDVFVGSYIGVVNESLAIVSISVSFLRERRENMSKGVVSNEK